MSEPRGGSQSRTAPKPIERWSLPAVEGPLANRARVRLRLTPAALHAAGLWHGPVRSCVAASNSVRLAP